MIDFLKLSIAASAIPWFGLLVIKPRLLTSVVFFFSIVQLNWFSRYLGLPAGLNRISLAFAGLLGMRLALDLATRKRHLVRHWRILSPVLWLSVYFFALTCISNIYNGESLLLGVYELRYYFLGLVSCFGLYFYLSDYLSFASFKKTLVWLGLLQIPFSIAQWLAAGGGAIRTLDSVTGTFAGYGELVACQTLILCTILFEQLTSGKKIIRIHNYFLCLLLLIPLLLSKSRTATLFVAMAIGYSWFLSSMHKKNLTIILKQAGSVMLGGVLILFLFYLLFWKTNYDINKQFNPNYVIDYYMQDPVIDSKLFKQGADPRMGRARAVYEAFRLISRNPINFLIGYGSGASAEASFLNTSGKLFQEYGPLAGIGRNHYSKTIVEFGVFGVGGFLFFFINLYRNIKAKGKQLDRVRNLLSILLFTLAILSLYAQTLTTFFFSMMFGYFFAVTQKEMGGISHE